MVYLGTKFAQFKGKYGKVYASKDKLYVQKSAFMIPKASPLQASMIFGFRHTFYTSINSFQRDFKVAISSWIETGISQKMEKDFTTSLAYRGHFEEAFWKYSGTMHSNKPLTLQHVLPSFMALGLGLILSIIVFMSEMLLFPNAEIISAEPTSPLTTVRANGNNDKIKFTTEIYEALRKEHPTKMFYIVDEATSEPPTPRISPPQRSISNKECGTATTREKGNNNTIRVVAEIHETISTISRDEYVTYQRGQMT